MTLEEFLLVLGAAIVHALWNTLVKADGDRLSLIKVMSATQVIGSLALIPFFDVRTGSTSIRRCRECVLFDLSEQPAEWVPGTSPGMTVVGWVTLVAFAALQRRLRAVARHPKTIDSSGQMAAPILTFSAFEPREPG